MNEELVNKIKFNEGFREYTYYCTKGVRTVGYGFAVAYLTPDELALNGGQIEPMSKEVADAILRVKLGKLIPAALKEWEWLANKPRHIQNVVFEMCYQMDISKVKKFKTTLGYIKAGEYEKAVANGLNSRWAKQTPNRARRVLHGLLENA